MHDGQAKSSPYQPNRTKNCMLSAFRNIFLLNLFEEFDKITLDTNLVDRGYDNDDNQLIDADF